MYRVLIVLVGITVCGAAIVPVETNKNRDETKVSSTQSNQIQTYSGAQGGQYFHPNYPEYSGFQAGYEGILVPALPQRAHWLSEITSLLPFSSQILVYAARAGVYFLHLLLIVVLGGAFTTIVCTFTNVCTINFLGFGITRSQVKDQVAELARTYITPESVNAATVLVTRAIDKYTAMQREKYESAKEEAESMNAQ